jgi:signal peptidase I
VTAALRKLWKSDYVQTAVVIGIIVAVVIGFYYGSQVALNTAYPILTVETGSMCIPHDGYCDGWTHPFEGTLHIGDILIVQGVNPKDLNPNYPNSDIIVFHEPNNPDRLIVHRIAAQKEVNGKLYFQTKGDGNGYPYLWPAVPPSKEYDPWPGGQGVSEDFVVGKVVARIPWFGHITLIIKQNPIALPIILVLIILLVSLEFVVPPLREKKKTVQQKELKPPS